MLSVGGALGGERVGVGREPSGRHGFGIGQRDHAVDGERERIAGQSKAFSSGFGSARPEVSIRM